MDDALKEMDVENWGQHDKWWKEELWSRRDLQALSYDQLNEIIKPYREARLPVPDMDITSHTIIRDDLDRCLKMMEYMVGRPKEFPQQLKDESKEEPYKSMGFGFQLTKYSQPVGPQYYKIELNNWKPRWQIEKEEREAKEALHKKQTAQKDSAVKGMNSAVHNPYSVHLSI